MCDNKKMEKFSKEYNICVPKINVSVIYKMIYKRTFFSMLDLCLWCHILLEQNDRKYAKNVRKKEKMFVLQQ